MTITRYITGFALSLALTAASFGLVYMHLASGHTAIGHATLAASILAFAIVQLLVQLVCFLHLGRESRARDLATFALAASLILFIVIGSLWIMRNLAENHGLPYHGDITPQTSTD